MGRKRKPESEISDTVELKRHFEILGSSQADTDRKEGELYESCLQQHGAILTASVTAEQETGETSQQDIGSKDSDAADILHQQVKSIFTGTVNEDQTSQILWNEFDNQIRLQPAVGSDALLSTQDVGENISEVSDYMKILEELGHGKDPADAQENNDEWYEEYLQHADFIFDEALGEGMFNELPEDEAQIDDDIFGCDKAAGPEKSGAKEDHIYKGAHISVAVSMLLIISFVIRHNITGAALSDLITLIGLHCVQAHPGLQSTYKFMKYFHTLKNPLIFHKFCSHCLIRIENYDGAVCPNMLCGKDITKKGATSFFIEVPIEQQIRSLFTKEDFERDIQFRFSREKESPDNIEDIYDGLLYRGLMQNNGILSNWKNLSLMWNTDGIPVFKSSNFSLWPLYFIINELPFSKRTKRENMIFGGLWFGSIKPEMLTFLKPFRTTLSKCETDGIEVVTSAGETITSRIILIAGTCDLPAKCMVCNSMQFNGFYGCTKCYQPGTTVKTKKGGNVHTFPFQKDDPTGPKRTHEETIEHAKQATAESKVVYGIKGPSWFSSLAYYDMVRGVGIDYMHGVLLGIMKMLLSLWFNSEHSAEQFSIAPYLAEVDSRLLSIKPPNNITRCPRTLADRKHWKASELRSFLLYYSIPCLYNILPVIYFSHFVLLSEAVYILLQESISPEEIIHSEKILYHFCLMMGSLYGERRLTMNYHNLLHLPDDVKDLGPLWTHSCFHFEDKNGFLLKLLHGTQKIEFQVVTAISLLQNIPEMASCLNPGDLAHKFYQSLQHSHSNCKEMRIQDNVYIVGATFDRVLNENEFAALANALGTPPLSNHVIGANRIRIGRELFHAECYNRVFRRNSGTIKFKYQGNILLGQIVFFFQYTSQQLLGEDNEKIWNFAMVRELRQSFARLVNDEITNSTAKQFIPINSPSPNDKLITIHISDIVSKCVFIHFSGRDASGAYVVSFPNNVEKD